MSQATLFPFIGPAIEAIAMGSCSVLLLVFACGWIAPAVRRLSSRHRNACVESHGQSAIHIESARL